MAVPVWRMTKAEVKYSRAELKVYHPYDDCVSEGNIKSTNLEEDEVPDIGEPLLVIDCDGTPHRMTLCEQCRIRWGDNWFRSLIRNIRAPWHRPGKL